MYSASPTASTLGLCETFFRAVHATCVFVTSPLPSGLIASNVGELYPVQTRTSPLANTGFGTTEYPPAYFTRQSSFPVFGSSDITTPLPAETSCSFPPAVKSSGVENENG